MSTLPTITAIIILSSIVMQCSAQSTSPQSQALYSSINKDETTNLYNMLIYLKTPLQPSRLHLDLGSYLPFYDCSRHYKSTSYKPLIYNSSLCTDLNTRVYGNCFREPGPGCANDTCLDYPENPVTGKGGMGSIQTDKFALSIAMNPAQLGPDSQIALSCTEPNKYSRIYRGLAKGSAGLASLGRFNYSLSAQISMASDSPWVFALCLPGSSSKPGIALFNSAGPYDFKPGVDVSKSLVYTPLILGPRGADTKVYYWYKSPDYYVGLTSFRVNEKNVQLNLTLLRIDENGRGGTKISTSKPYSVLQSSIYKALTESFKSYGGLDHTLVKPVAPFGLCYPADKIAVSHVGPVVPAIDLVLGEDKVMWRIYGSNSMVRIKSDGGVDAWCLGFVDGGLNPATAIVIGGHQIEDNLLQFDLEGERLGFSSSLLLRNTTCADFRFKSQMNVRA